jgi:hypothetical protein
MGFDLAFKGLNFQPSLLLNIQMYLMNNKNTTPVANLAQLYKNCSYLCSEGSELVDQNIAEGCQIFFCTYLSDVKKKQTGNII